MATKVNADNFVAAETARMFADIQRDAGGVNVLHHNRQAAPLDQQTVIRMNLDTLYSFAVVDVSAGATVTIPESDGRYQSVMVVDGGHYVTQILHDPGEHAVSAETDHVFVAVRTLVDPGDPADVAAVGRIQDGLGLEAASSEPYVPADYDSVSLDATRNALLTLAAGLTGFDRTFGRCDQVEPVRHLIGTAAGWGGLPTSEAAYVGVDPDAPPGDYTLRMSGVPVDAFWSVSVYNAEGYFVPNALGRNSVNSVTAEHDDDGAVTVSFVESEDSTASNAIPVPGPGWNYLVRLYLPRPEVLDGTWRVPSLEPA